MTVAETPVENTKIWLPYIDSLSKLIAACAIVAAAVIASSYESKTTSVALLNQREQSESALRASMFQNLIDPIVGEPAAGKEIAPDRQQLLVELLTLNFHDHFEFKPLLVDVDDRLMKAGLATNREDLASVARRVIDRQINMLNAAQHDQQRAEESVCDLDYAGRSPTLAPTDLCNDVTRNGNEWWVRSPDGEWEVSVTVLAPEFERHTVRVSLNAHRRHDGDRMVGLDFVLTPFDFPLTDYTQLDGTHRVALALFDVNPQLRAFRIKLVWFPPGYITERERPFDFETMRKVLKLKGKEGP